MKIKHIIIMLALLLTTSVTGFAQTEDLYGRYEKARRLADERAYVAAEKELEEISSLIDQKDLAIKEEIETLLLKCRIGLGRKNIDGLVSRFMKDYPASAAIEEICLQYGNHYFEENRFAEALTIYKTIDVRRLDKVYRSEYDFHYAFCLLRGGFREEALEYFGRVIKADDPEYREASIYYSAYIHYIGKDFNKAIPLFEEIKSSSIYSDIARYDLLESYFMLENYDYVILNGRKLYDDIDKEYKLKVARLLSEAYFEKDMPREAKMFFEIYSTSGVNLSLKDTYYAGIISYSLGSYLGAIESFKITAKSPDSIGQSSYYHIANCYINLKNKVAAMDAYRKAADRDFDKAITEISLYNYAKLAFDLNSDITGFDTYLKTFPNSGKADEIYNYIATAYILDKRYEDAINALHQVTRRTYAIEKNLQKSSFFRGLELMEVGSYKNAIEYFQHSLDNSHYNPRLEKLAAYWLAEAYYRTGDFQHAIEINSKLIENDAFQSTDEFSGAVYNLAYCYIQSGKYAEAEKCFKQYLDMNPKLRIHTLDAKIRLADSYFMQKKYGMAAELYEEAALHLSNTQEIYPKYQSAISYGLINNINKKIDILSEIRDNETGNKLYSQSVFELGRTLLQTGDIAGAISCYEDLLAGKDKAFYPKATLELGMAYFNKSNMGKALEYYKTVVSEYPKSDEAQDALIGIENIYQLQNNVDGYFAYLEQMGLSSSKTDEEKEIMRFNTAEQLFLNKNYKKAISALKKYIKEYPKGSKVSYANFYIAESLNEISRAEEACEYYKKVIGEGDGSFPEIAALKFADISYSIGNYNDAYDAYEGLLTIAKLDNNIKAARCGMAESAFKKGDYTKTVSLTESLLKDRDNTELQIRRMNYLLAKSLYVSGDRERSMGLFRKLSEDPTDEEGAESTFILIQSAFDTGDFIEVENLTFAFSESETDKLYWLAKSFIVLGDSYAEREEWKQALATFESILEGYDAQSGKDNIVEQVKVRIEAAKKRIENEKE